MNAYVINLDSAPERWAHMQKAFEGTPLRLQRISAVSGKALTLPMPEFDEEKFRRCHGRGTNIFEIACYLSHIKALGAFLESGESHAMIFEDDLYPKPGFVTVMERLMKTSRFWNIARLSGLKAGKSIEVASLHGGSVLTVFLARLKGSGAYVIDRKAALACRSALLPVFLPVDHAIDREWTMGLHTVAVSPFPVSQTEETFGSAIQGNSQPRLPSRDRWRSTYPYQIRNELSRWLHRGRLAVFLKLRFWIGHPGA